MNDITPRTAKATEAAARAAARRRHEKYAREMRAAGWICTPPEEVIWCHEGQK
jgi:hypothetical protein